MKNNEKRNLILGSMILVLTITIGYFGLATAKDTYALDSSAEGEIEDTCTYKSKESCEEANKNYNCTLKDNCYVKGTGKDCIVEYNANANANDVTGTMDNQKCIYDSECTLSENKFSRKGYSFSGFKTKDDNNTVYGYNDNSTEYICGKRDSNNKVILYAQWKANKYTIEFNGNDSTSGSMIGLIMTYDTPNELPDNNFTKNGYTFNGWNTEADGSGTSYSNKASVKNLTSTNNGTVKLYAQWIDENAETKKYTVKFETNIVESEDSYVKATVEKEVYEGNTIPEYIPEVNGYTFVGWYEDEDFKTEYDFTTPVTSDLTLYSKWTKDAENDKTDEEITENNKTGDVLMFIAWTVGFGALAYTVYYYKTRKEN